MMALVDNSDDVTAGTENLARCITETGTVCPCRWVVRTAFTYCSACAPANSSTHLFHMYSCKPCALCERGRAVAVVILMLVVLLMLRYSTRGC